MITGSASCGFSSEDIDIAIVSLAFKIPRPAATIPLVTTEDDSAAQRAPKLDDKHLTAVATEKRAPAPALGPAIQAPCPLPRGHDGNRS
jgi:hypothetical protein